jgi:hypothetical protein
MKKTLLAIVCVCAAITQNHAQTLIHYWNFNNFTGVYHNNMPGGIPAVKADYSIIDTNKALFVYNLLPGVSSSYAGYEDFVTPVAADYDTLNLRTVNGVATVSGNAIRVRNPSDSAYLTLNIPTTGYKNISLKFCIETSNLTASPTNQAFSYSTDSGATWKTTGLNVTTDTITPVFSMISINFGSDSAVNNNRRLIFKITNTVRTTLALGSGNVRYDNISVDGTLIPTGTTGSLTLVHYWNFNNFTGSYSAATVPSLKADYSVIDTNKTALVYKLLAGTSSAYAGKVDYVTTSVADSDIYNLRTINGVLTPAGNGYRFRNPTDSAYLLFYIPSTGYKNLTFSYAVEASSVASGYHYNNFSYSTDSGATFKTAGLDHIQDSSISVGSYASATALSVYKLITVNFTVADTTVNNNPKLVFKIVTSTNPAFSPTSATSGNNRFDNFALDGVKISSISVPTVTTPQVHTPIAYPNPANRDLYINTFTATEKTVVIYNIAGQAVYHTVTNEQTLNVPIAALNTGMYYVLVHENATGENTTTKFIKE